VGPELSNQYPYSFRSDVFGFKISNLKEGANTEKDLEGNTSVFSVIHHNTTKQRESDARSQASTFEHRCWQMEINDFEYFSTRQLLRSDQ